MTLGDVVNGIYPGDMLVERRKRIHARSRRARSDAVPDEDRDNRVGITDPQGALDILFTIFTTKRMGTGQVVCHFIVEAHDGRLRNRPRLRLAASW